MMKVLSYYKQNFPQTPSEGFECDEQCYAAWDGSIVWLTPKFEAEKSGVFAEIKITPASQTDAGITQPIFVLVLSIPQTTFHKWPFLFRLKFAENIYKSEA